MNVEFKAPDGYEVSVVSVQLRPKKGEHEDARVGVFSDGVAVVSGTISCPAAQLESLIYALSRMAEKEGAE